MVFKILLNITIILTCYLLLVTCYPPLTFAGDPPQLSSPSNGSTVSSTTLNWLAPSYTLYSSNPYRIQVDDDSSFGSPNKDYYTDNTHYTPSLDPGTWNWRVKAKDQTGIWSDWSSVWSFTLSPSPSETPSASASPSPTPSPSTASSSDSTSASSSGSSFIISGTPAQVNFDQSFSVIVNLSLSSNPSTIFYLKGAFKKSDGSNYFGKTLVSGSWVKNGSTYSSQLQITTDASGNWSGNLDVQPDSEDSGFTGTGDYIFKVGRYTGAGSGPTWSNEVTLKIIGTTTSSTGSSSNASVTTASKTPSPTSSPRTPIAQAGSLPNSAGSKVGAKVSPRIASVAGEATTSASPTPTPSPTTQTKLDSLKFLPWAGGGLILTGISSLIFIYLRSRKNLRI